VKRYYSCGMPSRLGQSGQSDHERSLSRRGARSARHADQIARQGVHPDLILCSTASDATTRGPSCRAWYRFRLCRSKKGLYVASEDALLHR